MDRWADIFKIREQRVVTRRGIKPRGFGSYFREFTHVALVFFIFGLGIVAFVAHETSPVLLGLAMFAATYAIYSQQPGGVESDAPLSLGLPDFLGQWGSGQIDWKSLIARVLAAFWFFFLGAWLAGGVLADSFGRVAPKAYISATPYSTASILWPVLIGILLFQAAKVRMLVLDYRTDKAQRLALLSGISYALHAALVGYGSGILSWDGEFGFLAGYSANISGTDNPFTSIPSEDLSLWALTTVSYVVGTALGLVAAGLFPDNDEDSKLRVPDNSVAKYTDLEQPARSAAQLTINRS